MVAAPPAVRFFVGGQPQTKGSLMLRHKWGPMVAGKPTCKVWPTEQSGSYLKEWRALVATGAARSMKHNPPFSGPVRVCLTFYFPRPKKQLPHQAASPYVAVKKRHDNDKLQRAILDALGDAALYEDDGLVADIHAVKLYVTPEQPLRGVLIEVEALT